MVRWLVMMALSVPVTAYAAGQSDVEKQYGIVHAKVGAAEAYAGKSAAHEEHFRAAVVLLRAAETAYAKKDYNAAYDMLTQADLHARFSGKAMSLAKLSAQHSAYVPTADKAVPAGAKLLGGKWKAFVSPDSIGLYPGLPRRAPLH